MDDSERPDTASGPHLASTKERTFGVPNGILSLNVIPHALNADRRLERTTAAAARPLYFSYAGALDNYLRTGPRGNLSACVSGVVW
jgi:hypothetical protein